MTQPLYYHDSEIREFQAKVIDSIQSERGTAVALDQTVFYPTSGGQPHDTGTLNEIPVLEVWEDGDGKIWHLLERVADLKDVTGVINWGRRFDHMQQHTGQHILSAAFVDELDANTIGFHLGTDASTIDLDIDDLSPKMIQQIENSVNQIIWKNLPIKISFITDQDVKDIPFRKPPKVSGTIRVIWVADYDASACGGTHVKQTGQIGLLKITGTEQYKGGTRVSFLCGNRALEDYQSVFATIQRASAGLSIHQNELADAITRMQTELVTVRRTLRKTSKELVQYEASKLWDQSPEIDGIRYVSAHWDNIGFEDARNMALSLREKKNTLLLLAVTEGPNTRIVCTRSAELSHIHSGNILKEAVTALGGRGGGSPEMAQGGAPETDHQIVMAALENAIKTC